MEDVTVSLTKVVQNHVDYTHIVILGLLVLVYIQRNYKKLHKKEYYFINL